MNVKAFFVATVSSALDLGIATPDDITRHVTPDVLAANLPRPLWARLLTACLGAPRVDATLVVETIGVPNLCEHVPLPIMWACVAEIAARALGGTIPVPDKQPTTTTAAPSPRATPAGGFPAQRSPGARSPLASPPPPPNATPSVQIPSGPTGPAIPNPLADVASAIEREERPSILPSRARTPTGQRFRNVGTGSGIGRLANAGSASALGSNSINSNSIGASTNASRRPQASAPADPPTSMARRGSTEADAYDVVTEVGKDDWKNALAVEDEQLVDWTASEETVTTSDEYTNRKR